MRASGPTISSGKKRVVAIFTSDWHLSEVAPLARSTEPHWLDTQADYISQIGKLVGEHSAPLFIAGDIFDRWNSGPAIINRAIESLDECGWGYAGGNKPIAIPGQHDLPNHRYDQRNRSAYGTLHLAGAIIDQQPRGKEEYSVEIDDLIIDTYPWKHDDQIKPPTKVHSLCKNIALIHSMIWTEKTGFKDAPEGQRYGKWLKRLKGYDLAVFGDNHKGFLIEKEDQPTVLNCGTMMRRKSDEKSYKPFVGLLWNTGKVTKHFLDVSKDKFYVDFMNDELEKMQQSLHIDLEGFVDEMTALQDQGFDWSKTVEAWVKKNKINTHVATIIMRAIENRRAD